MKTLMIACAFGAAMLNAHAQKLKDVEVPEAVKGAFKQKFASAKEVKWSKERSGEYEAEFETGKIEQSANFDAAGKWLVTETEIKKSELPASVQAVLSKDFAGYKIEEAEKAENAEGGKFYEVELEKGKMKYEVQLSPDGKVLKKEEVKE